MMRTVLNHNMLLRLNQIFFFNINYKNNKSQKNHINSVSVDHLSSLSNSFLSTCREISSVALIAKLNNIDIQECSKKINLLKDYNFKDSDCFEILYNYSSLLRISMTDFENALREWKKSISNFESFQYIIVNQPLFLLLKADEIKRRIYYFKGLCKSHKTLINFFIECPNVFFDDWDSIYLKVEYLLKHKRVEKYQLFHSKALKKQLDFIKVRIELLEKCGVYEAKITYPHKIKKKQDHHNPFLKDIIDTDDKTFSTKIAGITLEEYLAYNELIQMCYLETNEEDDSSDSD